VEAEPETKLPRIAHPRSWTSDVNGDLNLASRGCKKLQRREQEINAGS